MKNRLTKLFILCLIIACKTPTYLSKPIEFKDQVKGLIFECKLNKKDDVIGEILEVNKLEMKLLLLNESKIMTIEKNQIETGDILVALSSDNPQKIKTWSAIVNIMPLAHGFFGVFTIPATLAATIPMSYDAAKGVYRVNYPKNVFWEDMSKFARFPQGIPESIDLERIE